MKTQFNSYFKYGGMLFCSLFLLFACSKDDSSSPDLPDIEGGAIHVTGNIAKEGNKKIKNAHFRYNDKPTSLLKFSIIINGEGDIGGSSGFNLSFDGMDLEPGEKIKVGTYPLNRTDNRDTYFLASYQDLVKGEKNNDTYFDTFRCDDGEFKITESTDEVIKGSFNISGSNSADSKSVKVQGNFTALKRNDS